MSFLNQIDWDLFYDKLVFLRFRYDFLLKRKLHFLKQIIY